MNRYKTASVLTSGLYFGLFLTLLLLPESLFPEAVSGAARLIAQRASFLMLGSSLLLFGVRSAPPSSMRRALSLSVAASMLGLAGTSVYGLVGRILGRAFLFAAVVELVVAVAFVAFFVSDSHQSPDRRTEPASVQ